ncbi:hypothetical protein FPOAC2_02415 [Fusarium poae]|uniref:Pathogenicity protein n=1 Tax=Fusarium poae TaxID=36050 RepID=A0A1B8B6D2_FUSPO|nr:hypothetical protein FPOAC1_002323 [Fusarium poae]KAG8676320.1 hypothetical protein FPOAC1_002323 [Fusarium poae]OBS28266.1 hypothetical protein FPOA_02207 [Fusarium poae]
MKFSIVSTALLAQGIVAMPWSSQKGIKANGDEITVRIKVTDHSGHRLTPKPFKGLKTLPVCWATCFPDAPDCPEGWEATDTGNGCWSCCRDSDAMDL